MAAHASPSILGYDICDMDADGLGRLVVSIYGGHDDDKKLAARLLLVARNMAGGWERAITLLRAETLRQQESES